MEALKLLPELRVTEVGDRASFVALEPEWNALVQRANDQLFFRHEFFRIWVDNFAPTARLRVLLARDGDGRLLAALPLVQQRASFYGVPVSEVSSASNAHSCRFDLLCAPEDADAAAEAFLGFLRADRSWDVLRLVDVPEGGAGFRLLDAAGRAGMPSGVWESLRSPYVPLPGNFEALQGTLQSKFKANCRRRRKKLEERGAVRLERVTGGLELDARLEEGLLLEQSGWKGERGTAIAQDPATRGFYTELSREAAQRGWLSLFFHRLPDRAVAFHYGLTYGRRYLLLKPGYDEGLKECSPGQLLVEDVLRDCVERGLAEFDFLGPDMTWKRDWTDKVRRHGWIYVFRRSPFGRALRNMKFEWVPRAKEAVGKWRR